MVKSIIVLAALILLYLAMRFIFSLINEKGGVMAGNCKTCADGLIGGPMACQTCGGGVMKEKAYFISKGQVRPRKTWGLYWEYRDPANFSVERRIATFASDKDMIEFAKYFNFPLAEHIKKELGAIDGK